MKNLLVIAAACALVFTSCSQRFYAPAMYNHDVSYQPKPASFDSAKIATYVSLGEGFHQAINSSNTISFGELNISQGFALKNANLSYGAFGFIGTIDNSNHDNELKDPNSFASKNLAGIGGRASFNMYTVMDNVNFRYIGVEATYSKEYGDYAAYRRLVSGLPNYSADTRTEMFTLGASSEVLWHSRRKNGPRHALRGFAGKTFNTGSYPAAYGGSVSTNRFPLYLTAAYFLQFSHFWGAAELTRNDITFPGLRFKVGYKF